MIEKVKTVCNYCGLVTGVLLGAIGTYSFLALMFGFGNTQAILDTMPIFVYLLVACYFIDQMTECLEKITVASAD